MMVDMHRVDPNNRRAITLRIIAYGVTLALTLVTTTLLLYAALGYRFDKSGHVTRSGLLLVSNRPQAGVVYINNQEKDGATPSRFVFPASSYDLTLKRTGYHDWNKRVVVAASGVREVTYPLLIPNKLTPKQQIEFTTPYLASQTQDRKLLLTHITNAPQMQLIELDPKNPKQTTLNLPTTIKRENGQLGTFAVIEWALNNKQVLLMQTLPSGLTQLVSLDVTQPEEALNISSIYGSDTPANVHYVGGDTNKIYGTKDGTLSRYSLKQNETTGLMQNIRSYQPYSDDTILFDRLADSGTEIGIWKDKTATVIQKGAAADAPALLKYASFEDHFYFAVALPSVHTLTLYRDPLKKPILAKQLPLKVLEFENTQKLDFSDSSQFIMAQNGKNFITYDFEDLLAYRVTLPYDLADGSLLNWADSSHIQAQSVDGKGYLFEYDGLNSQALVGSRIGTKLFFANDYKHVYSLTDIQNAQSGLSSVSLVVGQE